MLSKDVKFSVDVNLRDLAVRTPHFTGADLKAMLYNAQLQAAHAMLDRRVERGVAAPSATPATPSMAISHAASEDSNPDESVRLVIDQRR